MRHGGDIGEAIARHGGKRSSWLDLSTGINPRFYAGAGINPARLQRLPEAADLEALLDAARTFYRVPDGCALCAAPGTEILIRLLPRIAPGPAALMATSYGSYGESFGAADLRSIGSPDEAKAGETLIAVRPNNPDGSVAPRGDMLDAARRAAQSDGILIVDEAYADADGSITMLPELNGLPVIILKSFGKFFGLPGLRLGFAIAETRLVERFRVLLGDWPVSGPALDIGLAALRDAAWQEASRRWLTSQRGRLDAVLREAGYRPTGDTPLFSYIDDCPAADLHEKLTRRQIWTRVFADRPGAMRLGLPADSAGLERLAEALMAEKAC